MSQQQSAQSEETRRIAGVIVTHGHLAGELLAAAEMIIGVRASSIKILSASSTIAKWWARCTSCGRVAIAPTNAPQFVSGTECTLRRSRRKSKPSSLEVTYVMSHR